MCVKACGRLCDLKYSARAPCSRLMSSALHSHARRLLRKSSISTSAPMGPDLFFMFSTHFRQLRSILLTCEMSETSRCRNFSLFSHGWPILLSSNSCLRSVALLREFLPPSISNCLFLSSAPTSQNRRQQTVRRGANQLVTRGGENHSDLGERDVFHRSRQVV